MIKTLNIIFGIFLLIMAVSGNFVAETLSCSSQRLLKYNMYIKNIVILMIIYFTLGFTDNTVHPLILTRQTLFIWVFFIIFNKMRLIYTSISLMGLFIILIMKNYVDYFNHVGSNTILISSIKKYMYILFGIVCLTVIYGFYKYYREKLDEYKDDFSYKFFLFGLPSCDKDKDQNYIDMRDDFLEKLEKKILDFVKKNNIKKIKKYGNKVVSDINNLDKKLNGKNIS